MSVEVPEGLRYTSDHEWLRARRRRGRRSGSPRTPPTSSGTSSSWSCRPSARTLEKSASFGVIESVKTASDLYAPVAGEVIAVNDALNGAPELVNSDPYGEGWMVRVRLDDPAAADALLDADAYRELIAPAEPPRIRERKHHACRTDRTPPTTARRCSRRSGSISLDRPVRGHPGWPFAPTAWTCRRPSPSSLLARRLEGLAGRNRVDLARLPRRRRVSPLHPGGR